MEERDKCSDLKIEMERFESVMNLQNPKTQMDLEVMWQINRYPTWDR